MNVAVIVLLLLASPSLAVGAKANVEAEDWQTGTVLEVEVVSEPRLVNGTTQYNYRQRFEIETDTHVYHAVRTLVAFMFLSSKLAKLTINDPVKYRLKKNRIVILDENGKQHKLSIVKKIAKRNALAP